METRVAMKTQIKEKVEQNYLLEFIIMNSMEKNDKIIFTQYFAKYIAFE